MGLKIRGKLLMLLLAIALVPLVVVAVMNAVNAFRAAGSQEDDMTLVVIKAL